MEKIEFYKVVNKLILPLFTGSYLDGEEESSARDSEVAFGKKNSLLIKPSKSDEYRLVLKRGQPFQPFEVNLLKAILFELNIISEMEFEDDSYVAVLQENAGFIRHELSQVMRMRTVPSITFKMDGSMVYGSKMDELFKKITYSTPENKDEE